MKYRKIENILIIFHKLVLFKIKIVTDSLVGPSRFELELIKLEFIIYLPKLKVSASHYIIIFSK